MIMNQISAKIVERTWKEMSTMSPLNYPKLITKFSKEQPFILTYLMVVDDERFNEDERELLLYLGTVVWRMMSRSNKPLPEVTENMIDEAEQKNIKMLEYLEGKTKTGFYDTTATILEGHNQPEVIRYVVEALTEDDEDDVEIQEENIGIMMIYLKTVIDCFDE
jgi:hypothetical protein